MTPLPLSLQLYSLRDLTKTDFAGTVAQVAQIGYAGVETAGFGNLDAAGAATAITDAGLRVSGMHVKLEELRCDLAKVIGEARLFGTRDLICPYSPPASFRTVAGCVALGGELNRIGADLRELGLQLHYHHHAFEFAEVEGRIGLDWLLDAAEPRNLKCEVDVYWIHHAGRSPAGFIREQGRRVQLLHLKDEKEIGLGPVDFAAVFSAVEEIGALAWYVVEIEHYNHPPLESARISFEQLRRWGKA